MAQYCVTNAYQCVPLDNGVTFNQGANFFVNPMTAIGLVELVNNDKGRSVVLTAASSQLGKMMIRLFQESGVEVIATVRKEDQAEELKANFNLEHVLNTEDTDFFDKFKDTVKELNTKHLLECISGEMTGKLASRMSPKSTVVLYGCLSRQPVSSIDPFALMGNEIILRGFLLNKWIETKNLLKLLLIIKKVKKMLRQNLSTEVNKVKIKIQLYINPTPLKSMISRTSRKQSITMKII